MLIGAMKKFAPLPIPFQLVPILSVLIANGIRKIGPRLSGIGVTRCRYLDAFPKSPYLFFLHMESMNYYKYLPCQILGHDFDDKSEFLAYELLIIQLSIPVIHTFET